MKYGSTSQLYPLFKIVPLLCLGIVFGYSVMPTVPFFAWLIAFCVSIVVTLLLRNLCILQSIALYVTVFMLGATLVCGELRRVDIPIPSTPLFYNAVVVAEPVRTGKTVRCDLLVVEAGRPIKIRASFYGDTRALGLSVGDGVEVFSLLEQPRNNFDGSHNTFMQARKGNGSNFDYASYLRCHGFSATTFVRSGCWRKASVSLTGLSYVTRTRLSALRLRRMLISRYGVGGIDGLELAVISAVTLGDKSQISGDTRDKYSAAGASHVLALSGLHLSIICSFLYLFVGRFRRTMVFSIFLIIGVWAFVFIVGMPLSVIRAAVMLTAYIFCSLLNRGASPLNALALAAIALLVAYPLSLYDVGFQMSFMSMLFIFLFNNRIYEMFPKWLKAFRLSRWIVGMTSLSLSANIGVAPLTAFYFGQLPCYFLLSNIVVVPLVMLLTGGSMVFFICSFSPLLQKLIAHFLSSVAGIANSVVMHISSLPGAAITGFAPSVVQIFAVYVLILVLGYFCIRLKNVSTLFPVDKDASGQ